MQILNSEQVQYCLVGRKINGRFTKCPGVIYQGKLFFKITSYDLDRGQEAISRTRQAFLAKKAQILFLVVEEEKRFTVWREEERLQLLKIRPPKTDVASTINLPELVTRMSNSEGVEIKTRRYKLKLYPNCFVGNEAVSWLSDRLKISREEAIEVGQRLIDENWIHHVTHEQPFQDGNFFYRFLAK